MGRATVEARVLEFAEALAVVLRHAAKVRVPEAERVGLLEAAGRELAEDVAADRDQPPFDRATRDGFAVCAADWTAGVRLKVAGQVRAGEAWRGGEIPAGCAVEIMTGAPVPAGADAVAMLEHAEQAGGKVGAAVGRSLAAGENIVQRASVAIVATGDELVELDQAPGEQQIRNSNSYALAALVAAAGGSPGRLKIARDTREDVWERIAQGRMWDMLLLSGGVSAGKYDLVENVLAEFGAEFLFHGVKMQPGKPVVFGRLPKLENASGAGPECYFFGLPGNPVSTQVTFHCLVEPLLRAMCGAGVTAPKFVQATLAEDVRAKTGLTRILPARLTHDFARPEVRLVGWQGSGDLAANALANCYAVLPDGRDLKTGDVITVLLR
jgi:molybdopterin molybdotransferase